MVGRLETERMRVLGEDWLCAWDGCPAGWDSAFEVEAGMGPGREKAPSIAVSVLEYHGKTHTPPSHSFVVPLTPTITLPLTLLLLPPPLLLSLLLVTAVTLLSFSIDLHSTTQQRVKTIIAHAHYCKRIFFPSKIASFKIYNNNDKEEHPSTIAMFFSLPTIAFAASLLSSSVLAVPHRGHRHLHAADKRDAILAERDVTEVNTVTDWVTVWWDGTSFITPSATTASATPTSDANSIHTQAAANAAQVDAAGEAKAPAAAESPAPVITAAPVAPVAAAAPAAPVAPAAAVADTGA
ncbi:hypothetical protein V494_01282, partial [Pseudogymnoascus sp. VKM F-4513 (FW-928)]